MSKTLEAASSPIREQWLPPELAVQEVLAFERRFGSQHLKLACHAALPLILSPELLNLVHINFLEDEQIPWIGEADFLLSPLCRPVGESLFEVEPSIREVLLVELENQFGLDRTFELAQFLHAYVAYRYDWRQHSEITRTQQWIAEAYLAPDKVVSEMTSVLEGLSDLDEASSLQEQIQLATVFEVLAEPLEEATQQKKYQFLLKNSGVLAEILYGDEQRIKQKLREERLEVTTDEEDAIPLASVILRQLGIADKIPEVSFSNIDLPDWLQQYLSLANPQTSESATLKTKSTNIDLNQEDAELISKAFNFISRLHEGQYRVSGEPYIYHPIAVAGLLREVGASAAVIAAGLLHDAVEDTDITLEELEQRFGVEVRRLVESVTKLSYFSFSGATKHQAENFRSMFLTIAQDIRAIVVKLADRLHNMRTLEHLSDEKQRRIALETQEIFAPLAKRLGIEKFAWELEDLAFKYLEPKSYRQMQQLVAERRTDRESRLSKVGEILRERLEATEIHCLEISGRPKHLYGIYQKMRQQKGFHEIYDLAAMRLIVQTEEECYRALAVVHDAFRPIPGRFKDYIRLPKPNRYQSLHTGVIGPHGRPIQVQIRTLEMHHVAEFGTAAYWKYEEAGESSSQQLTAEDKRFLEFRQLLDWQGDFFKEAQEYLEHIADSNENVYVCFPDGDVIHLKRGSTPVDFAYCIHTEVGNHCAGARVNGRVVPLNTQLQNGDVVEIIRRKNAHPNLDWLNFVVTANARNKIRQWYKRSHREENIGRGREILEKELGKKGFEALLKSQPMQAVAERCNYHSVEDLLAALGYGEVTLNLVVNRLREAVKVKASQPLEAYLEESPVPQTPVSKQSTTGKGKSEPIVGVEGLLHHLAGCCNPIPGEPIIGIVTRGRGIAIHRQGCPNVVQNSGDRLIQVSWNTANQEKAQPQAYPVNIQIEVIDRVGVFKDILQCLSDQNIKVTKAGVRTHEGMPVIVNLCLDIRDDKQLERSFTKIKNMRDVLNVRRISQVDE